MERQISTTAIITDSVSCIPKEQAEYYKVAILPVHIFFEGKEYRDGLDLSAARAYELLDKDPKFWHSAAATPEEFMGAYTEAREHAQNILVVTVSLKLSMFYESALLAKELARERFPDMNIEVIDTETALAAEGFVALAAARAAHEGHSFDEIIAVARDIKQRAKFLLVLETIRHAYRTGRIPKILSQVGSVLPVKPILTISEGKVGFVSAVRTKKDGTSKILNTMRHQTNDTGLLHVAVMHADVLEEAENLKQRIANEFNCAELFITDLSPAIGYGTGRGTLGVAYYTSI